MRAICGIVAVAATLPATLAWGVVGHETVATVAQIHLHNSAREAVVDILPAFTKGHLAPIAAWADRVRYVYHWSGVLHYITPNGDHPSDICIFDQGFRDEEHNVVKAIGNYTNLVARQGGDINLRFLTHFIGDIHQPLHLTGRERGGNGDPITFEGRHMSLHGLWDTQLLARAVRELRNYTAPTTSRQIEGNLRGTIYDPFIRWILVEGLGSWWRDDVDAWLECPSEAHRADSSFKLQLQPGSSGQVPFSPRSSAPKVAGDDILICPEHWAAETHKITCTYPFPPGYDPAAPPPELGGREYYGRIRGDKIIESLLVKGGIRLAAVLNAIFADDAELRQDGLLNFAWRDVDGAEAGVETSWTRSVASVKRLGGWRAWSKW